MLLEAIKSNGPQMSLLQSMHGRGTTAERIATNVTSALARDRLWHAMHYAMAGHDSDAAHFLRLLCRSQANDYAEGFES
jgi:hypothetical protein